MSEVGTELGLGLRLNQDISGVTCEIDSISSTTFLFRLQVPKLRFLILQAKSQTTIHPPSGDSLAVFGGLSFGIRA